MDTSSPAGSTGRAEGRLRGAGERGYALVIAVLILASLMTLVLPFLYAVRNHAESSEHTFDSARASALVEVAEQETMIRMAPTSPDLVSPVDPGRRSGDLTPRWDDAEEIHGALRELGTGPGDIVAEEARRLRERMLDPHNPASAIWGATVSDERSRIDANTAPPVVLAALFNRVEGGSGWLTWTAEDIKETDTEIAVQSTAAFPPSGAIYIDGERVTYRTKTPSSFQGCSRGVMGSDPGFMFYPGHTHQEGTLVLDDRVHRIARWRVAGNAPCPRRFGSVEELRRIAEIDPQAYLPRRLVRLLEPHLTVHGESGFAGPWTRWVPIRRRDTDGQIPYLQTEDLALGNRGSTLQVHFAESSSRAESPCMLVAGAMRRGGYLPVLNDPGQVPEIHGAVGRFQVRTPVNINTAGRDVLAAVLTGISLSSGRSADRIQPRLAEELADLIIDLRGGGEMGTQVESEGQGPRRHPFRGWRDLVERLLDPCAGIGDGGGAGFPELTQRQRIAIYLNAEDPLNAALGTSTMPFCFDSGMNYRAHARAVTTGAGGQTRRSEGLFSIFQAAPVERQFAWFGDQERFEELFRLNRMAHWMTTGPNVQEWLQPTGGRMLYAKSPDSRTTPRLRVGELGHVFPYWIPTKDEVAEELSYRSVDREELPSFVQSLASIHEDVYGTGRVHHYDGEPEIEGRKTGADGRGPDVLASSDGQVGITTDGGRLWPFSIAGWFRPRRTGDQVFLQVEADSSGEARSRINLAIEGTELVLRFFDHNGDDPLSEILEACEHRVELGEEVVIEEDTWYHFRAIVRGARPADILFLVDGFPQGKPRCVTWLTGTLGADDDRIPVESTEGFPRYGVLRIGDELVEYVTKSDKQFRCRWQASNSPQESAWTGGRGTRQERDENAFRGQVHSEGTLVELYGYASMVLSNLPTGGGFTDGDLGPFAVGRLGPGPSDINITIPNPTNPNAEPIVIPLGKGYEATDAMGGEMELLDPVSGGNSAYAEAFQSSGGFAAIFMYVGGGFTAQSQTVPQFTEAGTPLGGVEIIRYESRSGNILRGIQRGFMELTQVGDVDQGLFGDARAFITEWNPEIYNGRGENKLDEQPRHWVWVVPLSLKATAASDSTYLGATESSPQRVQVYHRDAEGLTEWFEYDEIFANHFVSCSWRRLQAIYLLIDTFVKGTHDGAGAWPRQAQEGWIGRPDEETPSKAAEDIMVALEAQGRPMRACYGTFSQFHESALDIHPVIWISYRGMPTYDPSQPEGQQWSSWGMTASHPGRGDRVAIRQAREDSSSVPWYTINWTWTPDNDNHTWMALKEVVTGGYMPDLQRQRPRIFDSRDELRLLKFPSGEMPGGIARVRLGEGMQLEGGSMEAFDGHIDEVEFDLLGGQGAAQRTGDLDNLCGYLLKEDVAESSETGEILLRPNSLVMPQGTMHGAGNLARTSGWATDAGVVRIGNELIVYRETSTDDEGIHLDIARGGRGFLGTESKAHGIGDRVYPLTDLEVTELVEGISDSSFELQLEDGRGFYSQGTLLIEEELLHYTRSSAVGQNGPVTLAMPRTTKTPGTFTGTGEADGAFRGRYGTATAGHAMGTLVYRLPFRYWDRTVITDATGKLPQAGEEQIRIADLAESSYLGFALPMRESFYQALHWKEYLWGDPNLDVWALVRIDGEVPGVAGQRVPWDEFPMRMSGRSFAPHGESNRDLLLMEEQGDREKGIFNPINRPGDLLEARLFFLYKPGSFQSFGKRPNSWKRTPQIEELGVLYSSDPMVLYRVKE